MNAGWNVADLDWETATAAFAAALAAGKEREAREHAARAIRLAEGAFSTGDPRLATACANQACCLAVPEENLARELMAKAQAGWSRAAAWIGTMQVANTARSSLFHMRMQQRHGTSFEEFERSRWHQAAEQTINRLFEVPLGGSPDKDMARAALERWQHQRPKELNDARKLTAAVYLLLPGF